MPNFHCNSKLPIFEKKDDIIIALQSHQVIIVSGETGSGKTSQLPLICCEAGYGRHGKIGITQPRRIAATSIAAYVAEQCQTQLGAFVGYKVRFHDKESRDTRIKFMTDGILLRELEHDRLLKAYDVVIIDEAHERSLNIDFLLGYMRTILPRRPQLRLIISSATINTALFSKTFGNAPIISASGRLFPVEIQYLSRNDEKRPDAEDEGDGDFIDDVVRAIANIIETQPDGDVLVFLPTERDILEVRGDLDHRYQKFCAIVPLFGRMPLGDQQAIFKTLDKQKIVLATNIAETSVTVPNIRYVVDAGLARIKRYDPSMRVTRLPVEAISQASAQQRAGRSGRVQNGVCVRLYSETDFVSRDPFTAPEIMRSNLGQVILSMASLGLGPIENFPFLEPPPPRAVSQGYASLLELGAIDDMKKLTQLGRDMAKFPLDPPLSRMIIEAGREKCLGEMIIIAAGLCVQDMRVRPQEKKQQADEMHAKFSDPMSDFLFYLKLWDESGLDSKISNSQLKKFCNGNFLSYTRMREWQDVCSQLRLVLENNKIAAKRTQGVKYEQIHRCVLSAFLSHIAKKTEDGDYQVAKGRKAFLFPGSSLYKKKPDWIVCGELVETSRLYARTAAIVDPIWCEALAPHLCKYTYGEPKFDAENGTVRAREKVLLFGLTIVESRNVAYGRINPGLATEIFIKDGLVEGKLQTHHRFFAHNKDLIEKIRQQEKKMRASADFSTEGIVYDFYSNRLSGVTSIHDLNRVIREKGSDLFLHMKESDILAQDVLAKNDLNQFPDSVTIGVESFPVKYEFDPMSLHDGGTVEIHALQLKYLNESVFDWIIPGFISQRIQFLLESLPKAIKKQIESIQQTSSTIAESMKFEGQDFLQSMCDALFQLTGIEIIPEELPVQDLPQHLFVKVKVKKDVNSRGIKSNAQNDNNLTNQIEWNKKAIQIERKNIQAWDFGDISKKIEIIHCSKGFSIYGFPAIVENENSINLIIFQSEDDQQSVHANGVKKLLEVCVEKEMAWLERELKFGKQLQMLCAPFAKADIFKESLIRLIENQCFSNEDFEIRRKSEFEKILQKIKRVLSSESTKLISILEQVLLDYNELSSMINKRISNYNIVSYKETAKLIKQEMHDYIDYLLNNTLNYNMMLQYSRYFSGFKFRINRAFSDMAKYLVKYDIVKTYVDLERKLLSKSPLLSLEIQQLITEFAMMVEEFKISTFAQQEIKTIFPISQKKIDEKLAEIRTKVKI